MIDFERLNITNTIHLIESCLKIEEDPEIIDLRKRQLKDFKKYLKNHDQH